VIGVYYDKSEQKELAMARLVVMYKSPKDAAAFDNTTLKRMFRSHSGFLACGSTRSAEVP